MPSFEYDISAEIEAIQAARYGREVRQTIVDALTKMNTFAATIDPSNIQGGGTTTVIANGTMYRLEDYSGYQADAEPVEMTAIIRGAVSEAKRLGFPGLLFPKDKHFLVDFAEDDTNSIIINVPDNFGVDLNGSTIEVNRIPTVVNEDGSYEIYTYNTSGSVNGTCLDARRYTVVAMACDNSYIRNGTLNGGLSKVFPPSFSLHDSTNRWPGTGIVLDGEHNVIENMTIVDMLSDGIRIDCGAIASSARESDGKDPSRYSVHDNYMQFMFKGPDYRSGNSKDNVYIDKVDGEYPSDFKYENGCLVSRWIRISGGKKVQRVYSKHPSNDNRYPNTRGVDFIENDVKELSLFYGTTSPNDSYNMSMYYTLEFAGDSFFTENDEVYNGEGTFDEPNNGVILKTNSRLAYEVDFSRLGHDTKSGSDTWDGFVGGNPLEPYYVKVADDPIELEIFKNTTSFNVAFQPGGNLTFRQLKNYYVKNNNGEYVLVDTPVFILDSAGKPTTEYYVKKSKYPLVRVKIPVEGLTNINELLPKDDDSRYNYFKDSMGASYGYFGSIADSSTYLQGIIRPCRYNTIRNFTIRNAGRNGITLGNGHHNLIENFVITGCYYANPKAAIDLEEGGLACHDNTIQNGIMRDCHYGICFTTCQENYLKKLITTGCYYGLYAQYNQSFTVEDSIFVYQPGQDRVVAVIGENSLYKDFTNRRFRNCNVFGAMYGASTILENCRIEANELFINKTSRAINCDIYPYAMRGSIRVCGSYYTCNFYDFGNLIVDNDPYRDFTPSVMLNRFVDCKFEGDTLDFTRYYFSNAKKSQGNLIYPTDYALKPIELFSRSIVNVSNFVGVSAEIIDSCKFENIKHSTSTPAFRARIISNCIFECLENDSPASIIRIPGKTNMWDLYAISLMVMFL